jgi:hypothetical protein
MGLAVAKKAHGPKAILLRLERLVLAAGADGQVEWRLALNPFFSNMVVSCAANWHDY